MNSDRIAKAWYRHPMMWLVIAPPVGSVIAGIITMILILEHPDPVCADAASGGFRSCTAVPRIPSCHPRNESVSMQATELLSLRRSPWPVAAPLRARLRDPKSRCAARDAGPPRS